MIEEQIDRVVLDAELSVDAVYLGMKIKLGFVLSADYSGVVAIIRNAQALRKSSTR